MPINKQFTPEGFSSLSEGKRITNYTSTRLAEAKASGEILEATVTLCDSEHNLFVDLGCVKGIIPRKEGAIGIAEGKTRDIALISKVGKPVSFVVEELTYDSDGKLTAYLSRTKAQKKFLKYFSENYGNGDVITAKITHLEKFGAFCDIGCGVIALLPIDAISVSRIAHPSDRFSVGEDIKVIIKSVDNDGKITLSHKELLGTWEENAALFSEGMTVSGVVRSKESYGIFVELAPNLAGLAEPKDGVLPGMTAGVFIKSIIPEKMKIKLIIIDSFPGQVKRCSKYFYEEKHIDLWQYSPENCPKKIYTDFLHQKDV
jgi:small subunit ribosomal protein S1